MNLTQSWLARGILALNVVLAAGHAAAADGNTPASVDKTVKVDDAVKDAEKSDDTRPCHWWRFGRCEERLHSEGLPNDAPRTGTLITVDVARNKLYLWRDGELVERASVATGSGKVLKKGGKTWLFHTPRGRMKVLRKLEDPIWTKPDWAFVEEGKPVPPPDSPARKVKGHLGKYALDLGDGIMIHGTDDVDSFGRRVSHGCIRVPDETLETLFNSARVGTEVYIFESEMAEKQASKDGKPEHHSDLDYVN